MRSNKCKYCKKFLTPMGCDMPHGKVALYCTDCEIVDRVMTEEEFVQEERNED